MIQNIIFDLGGVLLDVNFSKTRDAFIDLGYDHFDEFYTQFHSNPLFERLEIGTISNNEFLEELQQHGSGNITHEQLINAWNALIGDFRMQEINFANSLKEQYRVYLFSNTNAIHYDVFQAKYLGATGHSFDENFHEAHYSHIIHHRKPLVETYKAVLEKSGLIAAETIFIDDSPPNIKGAAEAGLQTLLLKPGELVSEKLPALL